MKKSTSDFPTTKCITCNETKEDNHFYLRRPNECMDCVDSEHHDIFSDPTYADKLAAFRKSYL